MRGAAISDIHLGFRRFPATVNGRNAREIDVELAWQHVVSGVIDAQPDIVTIAGDVFHHPRITDFARLAFLKGIQTILSETKAHVVVLQGNHDSGRTLDVLSPILLATALDHWRDRIHVAANDTELTIGEAVVVCRPFVPGRDTWIAKPEPGRLNILVAHGALNWPGAPPFYGKDSEIPRHVLDDGWDVIHLGDYHEFVRLPGDGLYFYSGAIERTTSNIWEETGAKGFVLWSTESGSVDHITVPVRPTTSLEIASSDNIKSELDAKLQAIMADSSLDETVVRLVVHDFPRADRMTIDWALVRKIKHKCLHFELDIRYMPDEITDLGDRRTRGRKTLAEEAVEFFANDKELVRKIVFSAMDIESGAVQ